MIIMVTNVDHSNFSDICKTASRYFTMILKSDHHLIWVEIVKFNFDRWSSIEFQNIFTFTYLLRVDNLEVPCSNMHASHWSLYWTYPCGKAVLFKVLFWWQHRWRITGEINFLNTPKREIMFLSIKFSTEF